jgi:hypothetical protein
MCGRNKAVHDSAHDSSSVYCDSGSVQYQIGDWHSWLDLSKALDNSMQCRQGWAKLGITLDTWGTQKHCTVIKELGG